MEKASPRSSFNKEWDFNKSYVFVTASGTNDAIEYTYSIALLDEGGNGVNLTKEVDLDNGDVSNTTSIASLNEVVVGSYEGRNNGDVSGTFINYPQVTNAIVYTNEESDNVLLNSSMKNSNQYWHNWGGATITENPSLFGKNSLRIFNTGLTSNSYHENSQEIDLSRLTKGGVYELSFYIYSPSGVVNDEGIEAGLVMHRDNGDVDYYNAHIKLTNAEIPRGTWQKLTKHFTLPTDLNKATFKMNLVRNGEVYYAMPRLVKIG